MKLSKIFALSLAVIAFASCSSDDDGFNTADNVTVSMEYPSIEIKENAGYVKLPVILTGEANGPVQVKLQVSETTSNPAMENVHYYVTTKELTIPVGVTSVSAEFYPTENPAPDEDRSFQITIAEAEGAVISGNASTTVTITDMGVSPSPEELLAGTWRMEATSYWTGPLSYDLEISEGENGEMLFDGFAEAPCVLTAKYIYNPEIYSGYMTVEAGVKVGGPFNFQDVGPADLYEGIFTGSGVSLEGTMTGKWDADFKALVFDKGIGICLISNGAQAGFFDVYEDWKLVYTPAE